MTVDGFSEFMKVLRMNFGVLAERVFSDHLFCGDPSLPTTRNVTYNVLGV
jgi:hypothetical protein